MELKLTKTFLSKRPSRGSFTTASGNMVFQEKKYWRLFTSTLLHADLNHLAHDSFYFLGLSFLLNGYFGFLVFPI